MKCVICKHGETAAGQVNVTLERGETVVVVKQVPAEVCQDCGEYYLDEATTGRVLAIGDDAVRRQTEIEIVRYAA